MHSRLRSWKISLGNSSLLIFIQLRASCPPDSHPASPAMVALFKVVFSHYFLWTFPTVFIVRTLMRMVWLFLEYMTNILYHEIFTAKKSQILLKEEKSGIFNRNCLDKQHWTKVFLTKSIVKECSLYWEREHESHLSLFQIAHFLLNYGKCLGDHVVLGPVAHHLGLVGGLHGLRRGAEHGHRHCLSHRQHSTALGKSPNTHIIHSHKSEKIVYKKHWISLNFLAFWFPPQVHIMLSIVPNVFLPTILQVRSFRIGLLP